MFCNDEREIVGTVRMKCVVDERWVYLPGGYSFTAELAEDYAEQNQNLESPGRRCLRRQRNLLFLNRICGYFFVA